MGRVLARPGRGGGCQGDRKWQIASLTRIVVEPTISHFRNCENVNMWGEEVSVKSGPAHPDPYPTPLTPASCMTRVSRILERCETGSSAQLVPHRQAGRSSLPTPDPFSSDPWATLAGISAETTISDFRNCENVGGRGRDEGVRQTGGSSLRPPISYFSLFLYLSVIDKPPVDGRCARRRRPVDHHRLGKQCDSPQPVIDTLLRPLAWRRREVEVRAQE